MVRHERAIEEELGILISLADPSSDCLDLPSLVTHGVDSPRACTSHLLVSYVHAPANVYVTCHRVTSPVFIILLEQRIFICCVFVGFASVYRIYCVI